MRVLVIDEVHNILASTCRKQRIALSHCASSAWKRWHSLTRDCVRLLRNTQPSSRRRKIHFPGCQKRWISRK
ncbi:hypothetical protein PY649_31865 [Rhizobium mayense]|uniref:Uncharacterized protein n=1 Tax=Rhizobium mayense TaxID=1312184 RepID=A0ABT7K8K3_9HYPH|nr:hypothetical protein [Rhizobium mayense]MDL2403474.1 hypothetical protein [Rhizobium mayense]